jgi:hypothetical protein
MLGTQSGGLNPNQVKNIMQEYLANLPEIHIEIYDFDLDEGDPLFQSLVDLCRACDSKKILTSSGINSMEVEKIIDLVTTGQVRSLARLTNSNVIGEKSLDKLYLLLTKRNKGNQSAQPTQMDLL